MKLDDLPEGVLASVVAQLREEEPDAIGIFVFGSYAHETAGGTSDLDLQVVTPGPPRVDYRTWFRGEQHVSASAKSVEQIRARCAEPAAWALRFPVVSPGVWVWSTPAAVEALGEPPGFTHPAGRPELEDFVEWCAKALRAADPISLRVAARGVGEEAPALLRDLNPPEAVRSRVDAVRVALAYRTAPEGWADDLAVVLGLEPRDDAGVHAAVARLARGALALLRERNSPIGDWAPELNRYLHDGTLERHLSGGGPT
jgi:predicted nucleotidyltransferase